MERGSKLLAILAITIMATTLITPLILTNNTRGADDSSWYKNVSGVLSSDYYSLYPFNHDKSLTFGFSKFGEMIDDINNIGLEYRDRDAFAPPAGPSVPQEITKKKWMSGWFINITYKATSELRNVWAMAQHADLVEYGQDWIRVSSSYGYSGVLNESQEDPRKQGKLIGTGVGPVNGGRKTNGTATTDDITVLYNGPRMYIARTVTHIFDWDPAWTEDEPLVDVVFTFIFNKDMKELIVIKDIKEVTTKFVFGQMTVPINATGNGVQVNATVNGAIIQFSNRGEWDIGPANNYDSYVHFYTAGNGEPQSTVYNAHYHLNPTLYNGTIPSLANQSISDYGNQPSYSGTYDVAQIVSSDMAYVGWAAFWPSLSNWHVDAGYKDKWWHSLQKGESIVDTSPEPFTSPYLIGEWDFVLTKRQDNVTGDGGSPYNTYYRMFDRQFRGVTVYGLTDDWTGDDAEAHNGDTAYNIIDREVQYQLDSVFNPLDLEDAVEPATNRWVEFHTVTQAEYDAATGISPTDLTFDLIRTPVQRPSIWDSYCTSPEVVEWGSGMKHPARSAWVYPDRDLSSAEPYELNVVSGVGTITIRAASVPLPTTVIKVMYSTYTEDTINPGVVYSSSANYGYYNATSGPGFYNVTALNATTTGSASTTTPDNFGSTETFGLDFSFLRQFNNVTMTNGTISLDGNFNWDISDVKVFKESTTSIELLNLGHSWSGANWQYKSVDTNNGTLLNLTRLDLNWTITPAINKYDLHTPAGNLDLHIDSADIDLNYAVTVNYWHNESRWIWNATWSFTVTSTVYEHIPGRYDWVIVGNHSRALDSVGAAMVSAAFKNKQIEIGNGGLDMQDVYGTRVPYLLSNLGNSTWRAGGPRWTNIYDSIGRLAYGDDWCTRLPVATSNIITVAGPSANLMSEYFNEFSQALMIYGITSGIPSKLVDTIFATTCWNTTKGSGYLGQYYYSDGNFSKGEANTGIGVVTTYKDLNGTVGFMIYGWSGDDTYYTCKWFHERGIYYLQTENPGVTTLIIRLDYNNHIAISSNPKPPGYTFDNHYPMITVLERLGTISEKTPHDP